MIVHVSAPCIIHDLHNGQMLEGVNAEANAIAASLTVVTFAVQTMFK